MHQSSSGDERLVVKAGGLTLLILALFALMFFLPAGTWKYWEAWVYMFLIFSWMMAVLGYLVKKDTGLLHHRLQYKERRTEQRAIFRFIHPVFFIMYLLPGFDKRFGWSDLPLGVVVISDLLVLIGYGVFFLVIKENSYASRIIEVQADQQVISSGPYAIVRHPMYFGMLVLFLFTPLALGSWVAVIPALFLIPFMIFRIKDEETSLQNHLAGYQEYMQRVKYRLVPGIW
ncbi:MAG TPA: isoprenylcysteine carboxylmethyltransferase family protein [Anaerolineaceae bacterium]|nr:isoprenylcysteine carboxylmethyltransferase family protein [Anaerolineaceae bacterium]